jgi:hypothetical protein
MLSHDPTLNWYKTISKRNAATIVTERSPDPPRRRGLGVDSVPGRPKWCLYEQIFCGLIIWVKICHMSKSFSIHQIPDLPFRQAIKKPIPVRCLQIHEAFTVETLEGVMQGKPNDWLMLGAHGDMWVVDDNIFRDTYDLVPLKVDPVEGDEQEHY